jgi:hypothetical protein
MSWYFDTVGMRGTPGSYKRMQIPLWHNDAEYMTDFLTFLPRSFFFDYILDSTPRPYMTRVGGTVWRCP